MAEYLTIARPYAVALFEGHKTNAAELLAWENVLQVLAIAVNETTLLSLVADPKISAASLEMLLRQSLTTLVPNDVRTLDEKLSHFLSLIIANQRLNTVPDMLTLYQRLLAAQRNITEVEVSSAFELSEAQLLELKAALSVRLKAEVEITASTVDRSLIGGVVIRAKDKDFVLDGSIKNRLNRLYHSLNS